jgi:hypothetical protein
MHSQLAAGRGMGMASSSQKKKAQGKKGNGMGKNTGVGDKNGAKAAFDVNASMMRLEKRYYELQMAAAKQMAKDDDDEEEEDDSIWATDKSVTTEEKSDTTEEKITSEYVVTARSIGKSGGVKDWIPFAQLCLVRPESEYDNAEELVQAAVSSYCRELSQIAAFGAPVFSSVARSELQYSIEPVDSFFKYVFEGVIEGVTEQDMTKTKARETLGLEKSESDKAAIKQAYRKLSFELHPDRFEGSSDEREAAAERFGQVKLAYEILSSGVRQEGVSWYESLGGRARTGFSGPVNLLPLTAAQEQMARRNAEGALIGLERDIIQTFVARNLRSAS